MKCILDILEANRRRERIGTRVLFETFKQTYVLSNERDQRIAGMLYPFIEEAGLEKVLGAIWVEERGG